MDNNTQVTALESVPVVFFPPSSCVYSDLCTNCWIAQGHTAASAAFRRLVSCSLAVGRGQVLTGARFCSELRNELRGPLGFAREPQVTARETQAKRKTVPWAATRS